MRFRKRQANREQRRNRRQRIACWWDEYQWSVAGLLALAALVLGYIGFARHSMTLGEPRGALDLFYLSLQLFVLESGAVRGSVPAELQVARLLAPATLGYTAVKALLVIFREQWQLYRIRFLRDHVVVCGLGLKGAVIVKAFTDNGYHVVGIEENASSAQIDQCRSHGAIVLIGNASDAGLLKRARVGTARHVFAVCPDDGSNAEIAVHVRRLVRDRRGAGVTCFIHLSNPDLIRLLREREIATQKADAFRLELFNVYDSGARALLSAHPPFTRGTDSHVLVVGTTRAATGLIVRIAKFWHALYGKSGNRLRLTVVDRLADECVATLCLTYPALGRICDFDVRTIDCESAAFMEADFLGGHAGRAPVTAVYVCVGSDAKGLVAALALRRRLEDRDTPIVVTTRHETGLGALLRGEDGGVEQFGVLRGFGLLDRACSLELLLEGTHEILARATHDAYVREQLRHGKTSNNDPALCSWEALPQSLKNSNRRYADHIGTKLRTVGCTIAPLDDWDAELFAFTTNEVERLAEMEHARWMDERVREGWRRGSKKDVDHKISPHLVSWGELSEEIKEYDRALVRGLPAFLAQAGFMIRRDVKRAT